MDAELIRLIFNGVALGSIIALPAAGLTLTYGILRLANFAHGDLMTLGAYLTLMLHLWGVNLWIAVVLGAGLTIGVALLTEKLLWQRMRDRRATSTTFIIMSLGLALFIRNGIILIWGAGNQAYERPFPDALTIAGLSIPYYWVVRTLLIILALLAIAALHGLLRYTKVGKAMRAVADNIDLARISGINVEKVVIWTWVIAAGLTALGGSMYGIVVGVRPFMGWFLILPMFASVVLGGIGNPYGAIAGSFVIGITQEVSTYWLPADYKIATSLLLMMGVLLFRPQGIFRGTM